MSYSLILAGEYNKPVKVKSHIVKERMDLSIQDWEKEDDDKKEMCGMQVEDVKFTADDAGIYCGLNGALHFMQTDKDCGKSKCSKYSDMAGAKCGTGYCDAQCSYDMT